MSAFMRIASAVPPIPDALGAWPGGETLTHSGNIHSLPNAESCLRPVRAVAVETHENWLEATCCLNMEHLAEHKKE
jgi:hypothetical protein